jgi:protein SCO1/2
MKRRELLANVLGPTMPAEKADDLKPKKSGPRARYFPNFLLRTHEGKEVRFYDDLIHGKHVVINFFYADCQGLCPPATANLVKVQEMLKDRIGKDIFFYTITLRPEQDTPKALSDYAKMHGVKPGWTYLTGKPADIEVLRQKLGFTDPDPELDKDKASHIGNIRVGNELTDVWMSYPVLAKPNHLVKRILWLETPKDYLADKGAAPKAKSPGEKKQ